MTMILDVMHIVIGAVIVILAVISFLNPEDHMVMFPVIFLLGAALNMTNGIYRIRGCGHDKQMKRAGYTQAVLGGLLILVSLVSAISIWG